MKNVFILLFLTVLTKFLQNRIQYLVYHTSGNCFARARRLEVLALIANYSCPMSVSDFVIQITVFKML